MFFVLLAALMPQVVSALNHVSAWAGSTAVLPLWGTRGYACQAAQDPWSEGAWPMLMLLSTLVPTALHFLMVLWSVPVTAWLWVFRTTDLADRLERHVPADYHGEGDPGADAIAAIDDAASRLTWAWFVATLLGCLVLAGGWVFFVETDHAWLDDALALLKRVTLFAAYGGDGAQVDACLA